MRHTANTLFRRHAKLSGARRRSVGNDGAPGRTGGPSSASGVALGPAGQRRGLEDDHLARAVAETHGRWGMWGFSVLEVPAGDYGRLVRLRPIVATRKLLFVAEGPELVSAGFPLLPTADYPHWTVALSEPTTEQFARVRPLFRGPIENPVWSASRPPVR